MKTPYQTLTILAVFAGALFLTACGKSDGNKNPLPPNYIGPVDPGINGPIQPGIPFGLYAQNSNMDYIYQNNGTEYVTNNSYRDLMKYAMGVCDRNNSNYGLASCDSWLNGYHDIVIMMNSTQDNTARVIFRAYPIQQHQNYWFTASFPSVTNFFLNMLGFPTGNFSGVYNPMVLNMNVWPVNNNQGFEMWGQGPAGSHAAYGDGRISIRVENNKLEDPYINFTVNFLGNIVSQGRLGRCYSQTCGL